MTARRLERECARRAVASTTAATARTTTAATTTATRCVQTSSLARFAAPVRAFSPNAKPRSLETAATKDGDVVPERSLTGWRRVALTLGGYFSPESRRVRGGERLYEEVTRATAIDALYDAHAVEKTFASRHAMMCLHVWMCLGRLRKEGEGGKAFSQTFYDAFQDDVERRVHDEGVRVRVRKWLQDLERTFYGNAVSYDKALELGGGELVKALHRNVYDGDGDVDRAKGLERYVRHQLASLALTPTEALFDGRVRFVGFDEQEE
jgi:cytochrome b pre-mRNA-processing protein 3